MIDKDATERKAIFDVGLSFNLCEFYVMKIFRPWLKTTFTVSGEQKNVMLKIKAIQRARTREEISTASGSLKSMCILLKKEEFYTTFEKNWLSDMWFRGMGGLHSLQPYWQW